MRQDSHRHGVIFVRVPPSSATHEVSLRKDHDVLNDPFDGLLDDWSSVCGVDGLLVHAAASVSFPIGQSCLDQMVAADHVC